MRSLQTNKLIFLGLLVVASFMVKPAFSASFQGLGDLPGGDYDSKANDVSSDGSVVVGTGVSASGPAEAFRWAEATGMVGLGGVGFSNDSMAHGVSADGSVVVGVSVSEAFRWTQDTGMVGLGDVPGGIGSNRSANSVSADGSVVVGYVRTSATPTIVSQPFRWTQATGMVALDNLDGSSGCRAEGVSADGSVLVGVCWYDDTTLPEAWRWTETTGTIGLGYLPGALYESSHAYDISADGSVIVGYSFSATGVEAFRWTQATGMVGLGDLPEGNVDSIALAVSADGSVIVGLGNAGSGREAIIWDEVNGMHSLKEVLTNDYGLDLTGWTLERATGVSDDGWLTVVGYGTNPSGDTEAWRAVLETDKNAATLNLISPDGGETLIKGEESLIKWSWSHYNGYIRIHVYRDNEYRYTIASSENVKNGRKGIVFNPPGNWPNSDYYKIHISTLDDMASDESYDYFTITDSPPPCFIQLDASGLPELQWPLEGIQSDYDWLQWDYEWPFGSCGGENLRHAALDITAISGATVGKTIRAAYGGTVKAIYNAGEGWGTGLTIEHVDNNENEFTTNYTHIEPFKNIKKNRQVSKGEPIGTVANITRSNPHLHFSIRRASYNNYSNRGALPVVNENGDCTCTYTPTSGKKVTSPLFPEYFIDPSTASYTSN